MKQLTDHTIIRKTLFETEGRSFEEKAFAVSCFQYEQNEVYREYCNAIGKNPGNALSLADIPFLPIQFFKSREIKSTPFEPQVIFESSGTTGINSSKHLVKDVSLYQESFMRAFQLFYGKVEQYCILGLLPSYIERGNSSLVWMLNELIRMSGHPNSGFYLYDHEQLKATLANNEATGQATILFGVTYALLDFFEQNRVQLQHTVIIETGGMKGRKEEMTRAAVHEQLKQWTGSAGIHSEYGMTELLSQAYSKKDGLFRCPPWMKLLTRAEDDPFDIRQPEGITGTFISGAANIIDLANLYSCAFIATDDLAKLYPDGSFEISGRMDNSEARGCSLLYT